MFSIHQDQAAGLRKLMAEPKPRVVSVLSALGDFTTQHHESARVLSQLASSLGAAGFQTHVIYAANPDPDALKQWGLLQTPAISELLMTGRPLLDGFNYSGLGYSSSRLTNHLSSHEGSGELNACVHKIANVHDIVLVQTSVTETRQLPLPLLNEGRIIVQLSQKPASVKQAYRIIKQLYGGIGSKPFGILVHAPSASQAEVVFRNIERVARQFLGIKLEYLGHLPSDERLQQAHQLGCSVTDAFPASRIAKALTSLASRLLGYTRQAI